MNKIMLTEIGITILIIQTAQLPRWNFRKAGWKIFNGEVHKSHLSLKIWAFVHVPYESAKIVPQGASRIPFWLPEVEQLYKKYVVTGEPELADELLQTLYRAREAKWKETSISHTPVERSGLRTLKCGTDGIDDSLQDISCNEIPTNQKILS